MRRNKIAEEEARQAFIDARKNVPASGSAEEAEICQDMFHSEWCALKSHDRQLHHGACYILSETSDGRPTLGRVKFSYEKNRFLCPNGEILCVSWFVKELDPIIPFLVECRRITESF